MDNLTAQEIERLASIATSSLETQRGFREAFNHLLRCFGDGADASALVLFIDHQNGTLNMHALDVSVSDSVLILELAHRQAVQALHGEMLVAQTPSTVQ